MLLLKVLTMYIPISWYFTVMVVMAMGICREEESFIIICGVN